MRVLHHLKSAPKKVATYGLLFAIAVIVISFVAYQAYQAIVSANTALSFDAGNIMTDEVMRNKSSMSVSKIQAFLNSKGTTCTSGNCLKTYKENGKSAAQIIYNTAREYNINPQVLIVLVQKETGLVTVNNPASWRYRTATGYGCPDSTPGACDSKYYGFTNQLKWAATMFNAILSNSPTWYAPYTVGNNNILYHPHNNCGTKKVNIKNRATAALYSYTPYVPNQAALNAGYGTGNSCSSYGNRNFYVYFNDWFGSSIAGYSYSFERLVGDSPSVLTSDSGSLANYTKTVSLGNKLYVFHYNATKRALQLTHWNGTRWNTTILDGATALTKGSVSNDVGRGIDAFVYHGELQVYYYDSTEKSLRHAWSSGKGTSWKTETMEGTKGSLSSYSGSVGRYVNAFQYGKSGIQLFYFDETLKGVRHAWWDSGKQKWGFETFDGDRNSVGGSTDVVGYQIDGMVWENNGIQLFYYNSTSQSLKHAWWDSGKQKWGFETFDGDRNSVIGSANDTGNAVSVAVYNKGLQLFYFDKTAGELKHAWWKSNQQKWGVERFDGDTNTKIGNYINAGRQIHTVNYQSGLYVFYYDDASVFSNAGRTSGWRVAYWQNGNWYGRMYDGGNTSLSGSTSAVAGDFSATPFNSGRQLQTFYQDSSGGLRHGWINAIK